MANAVSRHSLSDLDFVIVRENTEGLYAGAGGTVHRGTEFETATEESLNTWAGVRRCVRYAAELAAGRSGRLTLVHKTNVLTHAGDLWQRVATEVAAEPASSCSYAHVDAACLWMVDDPERFDVIVTDNLFGDILSDLGAALTGGLGLRAERQPEPGPDRAVGVRAGARLGAGHRGQGAGQPGGRGAVGRADAGPPGRARGGAPTWTPRSPRCWRPGAPATTAEWDKALLARARGAGS